MLFVIVAVIKGLDDPKIDMKEPNDVDLNPLKILLVTVRVKVSKVE